ncbi:MAG TPA: amino acid racemase [Pyrinomonadaceae bacterium]|nr:amino acid racemase [Pyrinomonadaceae bacterium]
MTNIATIGILGGMGPEATNQLCALISANTTVAKDQDHIPVITYNNSLIPSRERYAQGNGESPVPEMIRTARVLEAAGATFLLMPCNLAHLFWREVQEAISIPLVNMIEETVKYIDEHHPQSRRIGILASTPTIENGIYQQALRAHGRQLVAPDAYDQTEFVMRAIYGAKGIKGGYKDAPRAMLTGAAKRLVAEGAELIIAGCTEVSLVLSSDNSPFTVVDPLEILARVAVARAKLITEGEPREVSPVREWRGA